MAVEESTFGFEGFDFSVSVSGAAAPTFGDLFAGVLQRDLGRQEGAPERGADLHQAIAISFEEAMRGGQRELTVSRQEHCRTCRGVGRLHVSESRCAHCRGAGVVKSARGHMVFSKPCVHCDGSGRQRQASCPTCAGQQVEMRSEPLTINVPPGLADGARIRVPAKGHVGRNGGENGDLYITVHVQPHPLFRREGDDLHLVVPVAIHEAALGAKIEVPSPDEGAARPCACRRARSPASGSGSASAASRRRATAAAATSSSKCGSCCRSCSTNDRRSCCGSSGGSTAKT